MVPPRDLCQWTETIGGLRSHLVSRALDLFLSRDGAGALVTLVLELVSQIV